MKYKQARDVELIVRLFILLVINLWSIPYSYASLDGEVRVRVANGNKNSQVTDSAVEEGGKEDLEVWEGCKEGKIFTSKYITVSIIKYF